MGQFLLAIPSIVSSKVWSSLIVAGFLISTVTDPILAIGGAIVILGSVVALVVKLSRWIDARTARQYKAAELDRRLIRMIDQWDGVDGDGVATGEGSFPQRLRALEQQLGLHK